jgi:LmbE family N-acetylglucosaminyl deacetylase
LVLAVGAGLGAAESNAEAAPSTGAEIQAELKRLGTVATLLHVGAHPDDENTQLITDFARGRGYRTAYSSLTRGDGGQNEIGPEFDEKLGVARTQELAGRAAVGWGTGSFSRGRSTLVFSKTPEETLTFWDRQQVLGDVVRVIRQFRPDVVVTRFPIPPGSGGHGHHTASGILAVEAFKLAGDPQAYPEQLRQGLNRLCKPKRVVWNGFGSGRGGGGGLLGSDWCEWILAAMTRSRARPLA